MSEVRHIVAIVALLVHVSSIAGETMRTIDLTVDLGSPCHTLPNLDIYDYYNKIYTDCQAQYNILMQTELRKLKTCQSQTRNKRQLVEAALQLVPYAQTVVSNFLTSKRSEKRNDEYDNEAEINKLKDQLLDTTKDIVKSQTTMKELVYHHLVDNYLSHNHCNPSGGLHHY